MPTPFANDPIGNGCAIAMAVFGLIATAAIIAAGAVWAAFLAKWAWSIYPLR